MSVSGVKPAFTDPNLLDKKIEEYFKMCELSKEIYNLRSGDVKIRQTFPSVVGLAVFLGVHKDTIYSYINGEHKSHFDNNQDGLDVDIQNRISDLLLHARDRIEQETYGAIATGDFEGRFGAMVMGNFGYANKDDDNRTVRIVVQSSSPNDIDDYSC